MATRGTIYIVPNPKAQTWDLVVQNSGSSPFGVTNNILVEGNLNVASHDDTKFGHGLIVNPGGVSHQSFPRGESYDHDGALDAHPIDEDCFIRVGLRGLSYAEVKLPPMDGKPIAIDVETGMKWYGKRPDMDQYHIEDMKDFLGDAKFDLHSDVDDGDQILAQIAKLMGGKASGLRRRIKPKGHVVIKAVMGKDGKLQHWDLRFTNTGDSGFMGTAVFDGAQKNAGRGLESMAVPDKGTSAEQRILAGEDYGVAARPGAKLRLGVRGHSTITVPLPRRGKKRVNLKDFEKAEAGFQPEFFNKKSLREKRREKIGRVKFFKDGKRVKLREAVFTGEEARARSDFDPPELNFRVTPEGWRVTLEGTMPGEDNRGELAFVPKFTINGKPAKKLFESAILYGEDSHSWTIDRDALSPKDVLGVDTGALGWSCDLKVPGRNAKPKHNVGEWSYREHVANRWDLEREIAAFEDSQY